MIYLLCFEQFNFILIYANKHDLSSLQDNIFNVVLAIWLFVVAICLGNYGTFIKGCYFSYHFPDSDVNPVTQDSNDTFSNTVLAASVSVYITVKIKLLKYLVSTVAMNSMSFNCQLS